MTTKLEQEFFEAMEIEPKKDYSYDNWDCKKELDCGVEPPAMKFKCPNCENYLYIGTIVEDTYPPITSDIVLRLIGILTKKNCNITLYHGLPQLKEQILKQCIRDSKDKKIKEEMQKLF